MKCSLLTLSTFVDDELPAERHSEVDAHLVGCPRCSAGAATLREEKDRVAHLARVSVDAQSAQSLLEQVGIAVEPAGGLSHVHETSPAVAAADMRSEHAGNRPSLPWMPTQPSTGPAPNQEVTVPLVSTDAQPDLPLDGVRPARASWSEPPTPSPDGPQRPAVSAPAGLPPATTATQWLPSDDGWAGAPPPQSSWEAAVPAPLDALGPRGDAWATPAVPAALPAVIPPPPPPPPPPVSDRRPMPPTKLASVSGPAALWTRVRDAVGVRLALSRGADDGDEGVQIISGGAGDRGVPMPLASAGAAPTAPANPLHTAPAHVAAADDVELSGLVQRPSVTAGTATSLPRRARDHDIDGPSRGGGRRGSPEPTAPAGTPEWNAFAASSYPFDDAAGERTREVPAKPLGRHGRAVSRQNVPLTTRVSGLLAAVRAQAAVAAATTRRGVAGLASAGPNSRLYAVVAGIGLVFVAALLFARSSPHALPAPPVRPAPTDAVAQPRQPAAAGPSSGVAAPGSAPVAANAQTFGSGATGFQVLRMRYGVQTAYVRVVFDLGSAGVAVSGSPTVVVSFSGPQTMLVTFSGALPAGSTGTPPPGKVISSVSLLSSANQKTVYEFHLTRAVTTVGFYLASPTRFVLDLH